MIDIESADYKLLEQRCKNHNPPHDPERLIRFANALKFLVVKYVGRKIKNVTCYKSRKPHLKNRHHRCEF